MSETSAGDIAIDATHLSKAYRIRHREEPARITEALIAGVRRFGRRESTETFLALDDVSFRIPRGEVVGIIGRNGAGKSTLLKVLTRITAPTKGSVVLDGRVGSLLEVGTGFHPELTGRENVYLNGTLLGMRKTEISRRFDEIVDFAGVERFLDTPVKRYSSGMYVRLAFAVAAHLDTEILAIDEVLAVGDAEFQRKSVAKMRAAAQDGRTVLFVSHQMSTITALCTSAIFLSAGALIAHGSVDAALTAYRGSFNDHAATQALADRRPGSGEIRMLEVTSPGPLTSGKDIVVTVTIGPEVSPGRSYFVSCHIVDANGVVVAQCDSRVTDLWLDPAEPRQTRLIIRQLWLRPGRYSVDAFVCRTGILDAWEGAAIIDILPDLPYNTLVPDEAIASGIVLTDFRFEVAS